MILHPVWIRKQKPYEQIWWAQMRNFNNALKSNDRKCWPTVVNRTVIIRLRSNISFAIWLILNSSRWQWQRNAQRFHTLTPAHALNRNEHTVPMHSCECVRFIKIKWSSEGKEKREMWFENRKYSYKKMMMMMIGTEKKMTMVLLIRYVWPFCRYNNNNTHTHVTIIHRSTRQTNQRKHEIKCVPSKCLVKLSPKLEESRREAKKKCSQIINVRASVSVRMCVQKDIMGSFGILHSID